MTKKKMIIKMQKDMNTLKTEGIAVSAGLTIMSIGTLGLELITRNSMRKDIHDIADNSRCQMAELNKRTHAKPAVATTSSDNTQTDEDSV